MTDLPYRIKTVTSSHDIGVRLGDMGWDIDVFKILESTETDPEKKLELTIAKVVRHLEADNDAGNTTEHLSLSFSFVFAAHSSPRQQVCGECNDEDDRLP